MDTQEIFGKIFLNDDASVKKRQALCGREIPVGAEEGNPQIERWRTIPEVD